MVHLYCSNFPNAGKLILLIFIYLFSIGLKAQTNGEKVWAAQYNGNLFTSGGSYDYPSGMAVNTSAGYWTAGTICNPVNTNWLGIRTGGGIIIRYDWLIISYPVYADGYSYTYHRLPIDDYIFLPLVLVGGIAGFRLRTVKVYQNTLSAPINLS